MKHLIFFSAVTLIFSACGGTGGTDGGTDLGDGGFELVTFTAPSTSAVNNSLLVTVSGETAATEGTAFPPIGSGDPYYLDGWQLTFEHVLVTVGTVTISDNPDLNPNDQSQTGGVVAQASGPWAIDLAKGGPLTSKDMNGKSVPVVRILNQNQKSGTPAFESTSKYAFGFDLIVPAGRVQNVNLDADAQAALATMVQKGWSVWMKGTATWKGTAGQPACRQTVVPYDFDRYAKSFSFSLGFKTPTTYKNCINPDLTPDGSRGVQTQANAQTISQITLHLDHPFWEALQEDAPLRLDALASRTSIASGAGPATATVTQDDLVGIDFQAIKDAQGVAVPWRTCGPLLTPERTTGTVSYDPVNVPVSPSGGSAGLKDLFDYMSYNQSTFGHLNNDGLCFPSRNFAAPR